MIKVDMASPIQMHRRNLLSDICILFIAIEVWSKTLIPQNSHIAQQQLLHPLKSEFFMRLSASCMV